MTILGPQCCCAACYCGPEHYITYSAENGRSIDAATGVRSAFSEYKFNVPAINIDVDVSVYNGSSMSLNTYNITTDAVSFTSFPTTAEHVAPFTDPWSPIKSSVPSLYIMASPSYTAFKKIVDGSEAYNASQFYPSVVWLVVNTWSQFRVNLNTRRIRMWVEVGLAQHIFDPATTDPLTIQLSNVAMDVYYENQWNVTTALSAYQTNTGALATRSAGSWIEFTLQDTLISASTHFSAGTCRSECQTNGNFYRTLGADLIPKTQSANSSALARVNRNTTDSWATITAAECTAARNQIHPYIDTYVIRA